MLFDYYLNRVEKVQNTLAFYSFVFYNASHLHKSERKKLMAPKCCGSRDKTEMAQSHVLDMQTGLVRPCTGLRMDQPDPGFKDNEVKNMKMS